MSTTYEQLQEKVSRTLSDPDNATFEADDIKDMISSAWTEVGRMAPQRFQETLAPVAGATQYQLRSELFPDPVAEIELKAVEIWDVSGDYPRAWRQVESAATHPMGLSYSQAGWVLWDGILMLPDRYVDMIDPDKHVIRVWGYSPWAPPSNGSTLPFSDTIMEAVVSFCRVKALEKLNDDRDLFTQWQLRSNNTDVTPAGLMNRLNIAREDWRQRARALYIIREAP